MSTTLLFKSNNMKLAKLLTVILSDLVVHHRVPGRLLPDRLTHLTDCNFISRMLFYQAYWHLYVCYYI